MALVVLLLLVVQLKKLCRGQYTFKLANIMWCRLAVVQLKFMYEINIGSDNDLFEILIHRSINT